MIQPTEPLTDEQLAEIRDWLEGCKGSERAEIPAHLRRYETWLGEADGRAVLLLAEVDRFRAQRPAIDRLLTARGRMLEHWADAGAHDDNGVCRNAMWGELHAAGDALEDLLTDVPAEAAR